MGGGLPVDYLINYRLLLSGRTAKVDSGGLDAFMPHEVGKECKIVEAFKKVLGKTMAE